MPNQNDTGREQLNELFSALKGVIADNPDIQSLIRLQEQGGRQVLLNMSSVLRMVDQEREAEGGADRVTESPKVVEGYMVEDGESSGDAPREDAVRPNFFDRAFLKSLNITG